MVAELKRVQDDGREKQLAEIFELQWQADSRIGPDALDENANAFELKSTTRQAVSTARDLGPRHIEKWKQRFWIIGRGKNYHDNFIFDRLFFLSTCHMANWYNKLMSGFNADDVLRSKVISNLAGTLDAAEIERAERLLKRGMLLNDPGIPWKYVCENGIEIKSDHSKTLRKLTIDYPLNFRRTIESTGVFHIGEEVF